MSIPPDAEIQALLSDLWKKHLPSFRERVDLLERTAAIASTGTLPEPDRAAAQAEAHKLAGNLGMFGHAEAGEIALEIELILKTPQPTRYPDVPDLATRLRTLLAPHLI
jgi:HPt (histidine-containing phosphotransfer) domain-containing protein